MSRLGGWHMSNKESYYPNIYENGYTFSRIENLSYVPHVHTGIECVCVLAGNLLATIDGRRYSLHKDDICFIMSYHRHSYLTRQTSDALTFAMLSDEITTRNPFFSGKYDLPTPVFRSGKYSSHVNTLLGLLLDETIRADPTQRRTSAFCPPSSAICSTPRRPTQSRNRNNRWRRA